MKKVCLCALLLSLCLSMGAWASVVCNGSRCGCCETATRDYLYYVDEGTTSFTAFLSGTCDGDESNYSNWLLPTGWTYEFQKAEFPDSPYSPKGSYATQTGNCPWMILWMCSSAEYAVTSGTFGFDNKNAPHNVYWAVSGSDFVGIEGTDWTKAVGLGEGPVHAPSVPEPASLLVFASGMIGLAGLKIRTKR